MNYDKVLTADNHQWISYISYSGTRRYVDIATLKATESKPQENRVSGNLTINNQTSNGFDVEKTNVSGGGKEVKEVRVPIWSDKMVKTTLHGIMPTNNQMEATRFM